MKNESPISCVACSIFRRELEALHERGEFDLPVHFINSMMHMRPQLLRTTLDSVVEKQRNAGKQTLLVYGECHNYMDKYEQNRSVERVSGCNCVEVLLGHDEFHRLLKEGAFFLLPEWTLRWREVFNYELDLKGDTAKQFMREMHSYFLYIDTGLTPVPLGTLEELSVEMGLPFEIKKVSLDNLLKEVLNAIDLLR